MAWIRSTADWIASARLRGFFVGNHQAAGLLYALGQLGELFFQLGEFPARLDRLDQNRFELRAKALRIAEREYYGFVVSHFSLNQNSRSFGGDAASG